MPARLRAGARLTTAPGLSPRIFHPSSPTPRAASLGLFYLPPGSSSTFPPTAHTKAQFPALGRSALPSPCHRSRPVPVAPLRSALGPRSGGASAVGSGASSSPARRRVRRRPRKTTGKYPTPKDPGTGKVNPTVLPLAGPAGVPFRTTSAKGCTDGKER